MRQALGIYFEEKNENFHFLMMITHNYNIRGERAAPSPHEEEKDQEPSGKTPSGFDKLAAERPDGGFSELEEEEPLAVGDRPSPVPVGERPSPAVVRDDKGSTSRWP